MAHGHTPEFKVEALRMVRASGLTIRQVATDLGIGYSTLSRWKSQADEADLMSGPHEDQSKELERLRRENRILREEREILKKATVHSIRHRNICSNLNAGV